MSARDNGWLYLECYNKKQMNNPTIQPHIKTGSVADLAFGVVVLASFFVTFSGLRETSLSRIVLIVGLGILYLMVGIYGYAYFARAQELWFQLFYFAVQIPLGGLIVYLARGAGLNAMLLLPLAGHSVMLLSRGWMYITNIAILLAYILAVEAFSNSWQAVWSGLPIFLAGQIFVVAFTQMAVSEERARLEVEKLVNELAKANQRLREYASQIEDLTITKERNRIAREIHDGLGHYLTTIYMQIQAAQAVLRDNPHKALVSLETAQQLVREALADVRQSVGMLRGTREKVAPISERLSILVKNSTTDDFSISFEVKGVPRNLTPQAEHVIYRVVQEGLNNALKHAQASHVWVVLDYENSQEVKVTIKDNGVGSDQSETGFGLIGLRERVNFLNGMLRITSTEGSGFMIEVILPG